MFVPVSHDITIYQGSTHIEDFAVTLAGVVFPISGWTARMQIRETLESSVVLFDLTTENGGLEIFKEVNDAGSVTSNGVRIVIGAQETSAVSVSSGVYDLELVDPSGRVGRLMEGSVSFSPEVTR